MQNPIVTIEMQNQDIIKIELFKDCAPNTVKNFINLINKGFYNGLTFHRVIEGFMIQGGCPLGTGTGGPGYTISGEFNANKFDNNTKHLEGTISMARSQSFDSAGSQFFITHKDTPHLDGLYAGFGKVVEGMEVVNNIAACKTDYNNKPIDPQIMKNIFVETFGENFDDPITS